MKSTQYTLATNTYVQRCYDRFLVCTQKSLQNNNIHTSFFCSPLCLSVFSRNVYCVLLHRYLYFDNKCKINILE